MLDGQVTSLTSHQPPDLSGMRDTRARHGIVTSSPINLFMATGRCVVATRFVMDYGWYPDDDPMLDADLAYVSLWYTAGSAYVKGDDGWEMHAGDGRPRSLLIASEPLTTDTSTWLELPEYSLLTAELRDDDLDIHAVELQV